jgi:Putative beta-barrel porin-2, OmpL-like. bbp2
VRSLACLATALCLTAQGVFAEGAAGDKPLIRPGFFIDTYYSSSIYRPASSDRQYLTQIARDREFNINLAHVEAVVDEKNIRGRLALQFGTSVNANYQNEPTAEKNSNQFSTRNLQEAYVGYKFFDKLWLDAGIFFGHIGLEPWMSHSNWNYTRALNLDNVPYYAAGVRLTYEATAKLSLQLHILNGWQVITSSNRDKSLGTQISYEILPQLKMIHNTFAGNVAPDDNAAQYRFYNNLILQFSLSPSWQFALSCDVGAQKTAGENSYRQWYTGALYVRYLFNAQWNTAVRFEYFIDPKQVMVATGTANGFQVGGFTWNLNFQPQETYVLRLEYRNFFAADGIYRFSDGVRPQEHILTTAASLKL